MRVLIVDDSPTMRRIIANTLKKLGYDDVVEAGDGTEGLQCVNQGRPDLILTDWSMPYMDGCDFVRTLRTRPGMETIPVLMVTTHAERAHAMQALQAAVDDYLVKPFTPDTLREKLDTLLGRITLCSSPS